MILEDFERMFAEDRRDPAKAKYMGEESREHKLPEGVPLNKKELDKHITKLQNKFNGNG